MATITLKINEKTRAGQAILEYLLQFVSKSKDVQVIQDDSPYDAEFVKKIKRAEKEKGREISNGQSLWDSL
jgi:ABC-type branched-subunit amino acid transport system substrate-binding protein